jgi:hypothetical protein
VPLVSHLVGLHAGIGQQFADIDIAVPALYQLDIGIYYPAVIQGLRHV